MYTVFLLFTCSQLRGFRRPSRMSVTREYVDIKFLVGNHLCLVYSASDKNIHFVDDILRI